MTALFQDIGVGPAPGQEVLWILGLLAAACGTLFWQLLKAKDDYAKTSQDDKKTCMEALAGLNTATAALTAEMKNENQNIARRQEVILDKLGDIERKFTPPPSARTRSR